MTHLAADILVIGAGFAGAMIAAHLAERNVRVGIVDAQRIGQGATRRALRLATLSPHPAHLHETKRGLEQLRRIAEQHGALLQSCSVVHLATTPERREALQRLAEVNTDAGIEWVDQLDALPADLDSGLLVHDSALVDVDRLMVRLLRHPNITVRQHTQVLKLESHHDMTYVLCKGYTLSALCVVLATNAYVGLLSPYLADSVRAARGAVWTSRPLRDGATGPLHLPMPLIFDDGRLTLMPGGDSQAQAAAWLWHEHEAGKDPTDELRRFLKRFGLGKPEQTSQWTAGVMTVTDDGAPRVGRLNADGTVLYALGLGPYGLAWSAITAAKTAELAFTR